MHFTRTQLAGAVAAVGLIVPAAALAATINGGPGSERLRGTNAADTINGNGGNDRIRGLGGRRRAQRRPRQRPRLRQRRQRRHHRRAGQRLAQRRRRRRHHHRRRQRRRRPHLVRPHLRRAGNDTLKGGDSRRPHLRRLAATTRPSARTATTAWPAAPATTARTAAPATTRSSPTAAPTSRIGGDGNDVLWALARADVSRPRRTIVGDTLDGGNGDDVFRTRDGEADTITCGAGNDRALLDTVDVITDATPENLNGSCEVVQRKAPKASDSRSEDAQEKPAARAHQPSCTPPPGAIAAGRRAAERPAAMRGAGASWRVGARCSGD